MARVASGKRDQYVTIEYHTPATTPGFPRGTWATLAAVNMARRDVSADESFRSGQPSAFGRAAWRLEYRPDMDPTTIDVPKLRRLRQGARVYDIQSAAVIGRNTEIELTTLAAAG